MNINMQKLTLGKPTATVPCNGCRRCCIGEHIRILPHEDPDKWQTEPHPFGLNTRMLAHKENRHCVYLGETGCTIQHDKPEMCRTMDCRNIAHNLSFTAARKMANEGRLHFPVW